MGKWLKTAVIIIITAAISSGLTLALIKPSAAPLAKKDGFQKLYTAYEQLDKQFYEEPDKQKMVDGAIKGMVQSLGDPYSEYMDADTAKSFSESISSSFEGIGAELQENSGHVVVVSPIKGSPAEKAGIKPKDQIVKVNGKNMAGKSVNDIVTLVRGKKGTSVKIGVERQGSGMLEFTIVRDKIPVETVSHTVTDQNIGKIQVSKFSETTGADFQKAVEDLQKKKVKGIVIDLRQNPGGLLDQATQMSEMFIPKGKNILQAENRDGSKEVIASRNEHPVTIPTAVLIDGGSASAAEIMAAALHESAGVQLIGEKSFGKGTMQQPVEFKDGSSFKFTTAKWLTPKGEWIHKKGIQPDQKVSLPDYANLPLLNPEKVLKEGDSSAQVKAAQQLLKAIGYNPGSEDGFFSKNMRAAVEKYQKDHQLKVTGEIDKAAASSMIGTIQKMLVENDTQYKAAVTYLKKINP